MPKPIFILNGPNLNMLGRREPHIYGDQTLKDVEAACEAAAKASGAIIDFRQSNHEGTLVDWIQEASDAARALILNAGAYTHTSVALLDALRVLAIPKIEVHLSNPAAREAFRHNSYVSLASDGVIAGLGVYGYIAAIEAVKRLEAAA